MDILNLDRPYSIVDHPFCKFMQDGRQFNVKGEAMDGLSTNSDAAEAEAKKVAAEQAAIAEAEAKKVAAEQAEVEAQKAAEQAAIAEEAAKKAEAEAATAEEATHDLA